jgi:glycosyltransferase involved in cell wall biosynthesis
MPCFNHARYVEESIKSVLNQTEENLELIVVDDGSTDTSLAIIQEWATKDARLKPIYHSTNQGASVSRSDGLKIATGKYIAFCDADDLWQSGKLTVQLETLAPYPEIGATYCDALIIDNEGKETGKRFSDRFPVPGKGNGNLFHTLCIRNFINMQSALLRRAAIRPGDYFDPEIRWVEDWWFWVKIARTNNFIYNPEPLAFYRVHEASSANKQTVGLIQNRIKVYRRILDAFPDLPLRVVSAIYYHMGVGLAKSGNSREARDSYKRAFKFNPGNYKAAARFLLSYARS